MIWLLPKLLRAIKKVIRFFINLFAGKKENQPSSPSSPASQSLTQQDP
jgi:hypothetical protein